jgi:hypothetical protein
MRGPGAWRAQLGTRSLRYTITEKLTPVKRETGFFHPLRAAHARPCRGVPYHISGSDGERARHAVPLRGSSLTLRLAGV